jgi:GntR family transcriptional regulator
MQQATSRVGQIVMQIRALIDAQAFLDGRLPSEPELARQLQVSRATVRQALAQLESEGIVLRRHGVGTFVNERVLNIGTRLEEVWDFTEMIRLSGYAANVRHVDLALEPASSEITEKLALDPGNEVLTTANVFLADDVPVIYCVDVIPAGLVRSAYRDEELHGPVYVFLQERCNQWVDYNITEVLPVVADDRISELLGCQIGDPLHYFDEVAFNADDVPIMYSEEYYRPEYFSFKVVRKMTTR